MRNLFKYYQREKDERVVAIVPDGSEKFLGINTDIELMVSRFASRSIIHRWLWQKLALPRMLRRLKAKVIYCPGGSVSVSPSNAYRTVTAFRNMLPFSPMERNRYPLGYMRLRLWLLKFLQGRSFQKADLVIFISKYAKEVIDRAVTSRRGCSVVIPHGVTDDFLTRADCIDDSTLPTNYVLYVSIIDVYKAQIEVLRAWTILRKDRVTREKLILIGPEYVPYGKKVRAEIEKLDLQDEVIILGKVPYPELPAYYQHAKINLFASSCENCPNILLEALASGQPMLCSNYPPMPEFGSNAVQYFDPYNPAELAKKLAVLLDDPVAQVDWGNRAGRRALAFKWQETASSTWSALRQMADTAS